MDSKIAVKRQPFPSLDVHQPFCTAAFLAGFTIYLL